MLVTSFLIKAIGKDIKVKNFSGFYIRDFFLNALEDYEQSLTLKLHPAKKPALYSTSPLLVPFKGGLKPVYRKTDRPVIYAKITVFRSDLATKILDAISRKDEITLDDSKLTLSSISVSSISLPEEPASVNPTENFTMHFKTPCLFKRKDKQPSYHPPIPDPKVIFKNLTRIWNSFSENSLPSKLSEWIDKNGISITTMKIKTRKVCEHPNTSKQVEAFTGQASFQVNDETKTQQYARIINMLLKLAELANIGRNRTAGFGMINYFSES